MKRRDFLKVGAATAVVWTFAGEIALGQIPWEEELDSVRIDESPEAQVTPKRPLGKGPRNWAPRILIDGAGMIWLAWIAEVERVDTVFLTSFADGKFGEPIQVSEGKLHALHPVMATVGDAVAVFWSESEKGEWSLCSAVYDPAAGSMKPAMRAAGGMLLVPGSAIGGKEFAQMVWASTARDKSTQLITEKRWANTSEVKPIEGIGRGGDVSRPWLAAAKDGTEWLAWDQMLTPGTRSIRLAKNADSKLTDTITYHPAASISPALSVDDDDVWMSFHSNRKGNDQWDIPKWFQLRCYTGGKVMEPTSEPPFKNLEKEGTDQSFEFTRVFHTSDGKVIVTGRASHNFLIQYYHGKDWSPLYRLPADGWGGRGQFLEAALDKDENLWVVRRDLNGCMLQKITLPKLEKKKAELKESEEKEVSAPVLANIQRKPKRWEPLEKLEGIEDPLNFYFGDIHGHTWMSDGMGDVDEHFAIRRDYYCDDFGSVTDHDTFVGQSVPQGAFEFQKSVTEKMHEEGKFVTLYGQEYTTPRYPTAVGHKCIYSTDSTVPLFDHDREEYKATKPLYAEVKKWKGLVIPHHVGWTGSDWENFDPEVQPLIEIVSNHGRMEFMGNRPIPHRGGIKGMFVQDVLAMGHKIGIIGGSDSHGLLWQHHAGWKRDCYRTGLACVLTKDLTRQGIFDALRARRCYATTGIKPRIDFRVNNHLIGEEITVSDSKMKISVNIAAREDVKWLTIVKDNKDWHESGGEGYTMKYSVTDHELRPEGSFYYLRVEFETGDMAWTSPIWVKPA